MAEIIPAILESEWKEIEDKITLVKDFSPWVQIDISDGIFTPEITWNNPRDLKNYLAACLAAESPNKKVKVEVDLMVRNPELVIKDWVDAGARRLIVHIESTDNVGEAVKIAKELGVEIGLALNIDTPNDVLDGFMADVDFVQFMGIAKIGFQGQPFNEKVLHKIEGLRSVYPDAIISVDGGVNKDTMALLVKVGANRLVAGSAVYAAQGGAEASWRDLKEIIN